MNLVFAAVEPPLADAWEVFCGDLPFVTVHRGSIFDVECDAVVSPANSFGFMDGGIDLFYSQFFGWHVESRLKKIIRERHHGELIVGAAEIVKTDHAKIPYLIAAPTMRVPMILKDSVNPYLAARAALLLVKEYVFPDGTPIADVVKTIAFPGMGTGVGQVRPDVCARQMRVAIDAILLDKAPHPVSWAIAEERHLAMQGLAFRDLQRP
ncbi:MAG: macro domain-containing protein [Fibrella sp.]|nr:macro domain-containing protein [Armatimonadota bacterium]